MIRRPPRSTRTDTSFPTRRSSDLFRFRVDDDNRQLPPLKDKLLDLSWYEERWSRDITPGSRWRLTLRLRAPRGLRNPGRSEEHTSELQSLMRISYAVFCLKNKQRTTHKEKDTITP